MTHEFVLGTTVRVARDPHSGGPAPRALRIWVLAELGVPSPVPAFRLSGGTLKEALEVLGPALAIGQTDAGGALQFGVTRFSQFGRPEAFRADPVVHELLELAAACEREQAPLERSDVAARLTRAGLDPRSALPSTSAHGPDPASSTPPPSPAPQKGPSSADGPGLWIAELMSSERGAGTGPPADSISDLVDSMVRSGAERPKGTLSSQARRELGAYVRTQLERRVAAGLASPRVRAVEGTWRSLARLAREVERARGAVEVVVVACSERAVAGVLGATLDASTRGLAPHVSAAALDPPDLVVLDCGEPDADALATCARLARAQRFALVTSIDVVTSPESLDAVAQVGPPDLDWLALVTNGLLLRDDPNPDHRCHARPALGVAYLACRAFGERQELRCTGTVDDIAVSDDQRAAPSLLYDLREDSVRSLADASIAAWYQPQRSDRAHLSAAPTLGGRSLEAALQEAFDAR